MRKKKTKRISLKRKKQFVSKAEEKSRDKK